MEIEIIDGQIAHIDLGTNPPDGLRSAITTVIEPIVNGYQGRFMDAFNIPTFEQDIIRALETVARDVYRIQDDTIVAFRRTLRRQPGFVHATFHLETSDDAVEQWRLRRMVAMHSGAIQMTTDVQPSHDTDIERVMVRAAARTLQRAQDTRVTEELKRKGEALLAEEEFKKRTTETDDLGMSFHEE